MPASVFYISCEPVLIGGSQIFGQALSIPYSIIDMSLDGGLGGIVPGKKDLIAYYDTLIYGRLTAVKHGNGRDWWVIDHKSNTNIYNKLLVTPDTMILYQQQIGRPHVFEQVVQQAVFSPQGDKFVIGITIDASYIDSVWTYPTNIIDMYDFDRCTGQLSNVKFIEVPDNVYVATGCGFSANGRWLYVNTNKDIYQYDTWSSNINATRTVVATWDTTTVPKTLYYFQLLGPDGKIYLTNYHSAALLHVIDNPDAQGTACSLIQGGLQLPVLNTFVLPNAVNYSLGSVAGSACDTLLSVTISEIERISISVYPNPAASQLTLQYSPPKTTGLATVYNVLGEAVQQLTLPPGTTRQQVNITHLPAGLYLIKVETDGKSGVKRFVKQE
ncbi:MAG: T9SS type A sorting domain-containing protein [Bacteroidia bacterium]|nr:T9SS type A sorting domain-containing protein [Bacteroidia bacterium]